MKTIIYYLGVAALFTHEMDAIVNAEWRQLFHLRTMPDEIASMWFIGLHFPLFFAFFYFGHHSNIRLQTRFRSLVAASLVVHGILHFSLSDHPLYQFDGVISNLYIFGAAFFGLLFLITSLYQHRL